MSDSVPRVPSGTGATSRTGRHVSWTHRTFRTSLRYAVNSNTPWWSWPWSQGHILTCSSGRTSWSCVAQRIHFSGPGLSGTSPLVSPWGCHVDPESCWCLGERKEEDLLGPGTQEYSSEHWSPSASPRMSELQQGCSLTATEKLINLMLMETEDVHRVLIAVAEQPSQGRGVEEPSPCMVFVKHDVCKTSFPSKEFRRISSLSILWNILWRIGEISS